MQYLLKDDPELSALIKKEESRLENTLDLIAAENHSPRSIMDALGSIFNTKTIEGYPGKRFHAGCQYADEVEELAISRGKHLFGAEFINVQPHSGTSANLAVYFSVLDVGDRIISMRLPHGGHLSHGHPASITSKCFKFNHYGVNFETELIDYDEVRKLARTFKPKMIVAGASSYARLIDYDIMAQIAKEESAYLMVDMAHIAGLVAARVIPSPVPYSDFVTFTCYKTLGGARGGVILSRKEYGEKINSAVFPGCQGTSPVNFIAAKALCFRMAMEPHFLKIQKRTLENATRLAQVLSNKGYRIVSGGTHTHQVLVDLTPKSLTGRVAETTLESVGIITNRNVVPRDADKPGEVSGIRLGSSAISVRGMGPDQIHQIADLMDAALLHHDDKQVLAKISKGVKSLCKQFPIPNF